MKKLNRKGFTLVELLAVIVILAIVVGIAIPSVTGIINNSKKKGFETAVEAAGGWLTKQSQMMNVDAASVDKEFSDLALEQGRADTFNSTANPALWAKLGFKAGNVEEVSIAYKADGTACLKVTKIKTSSEYYTVSSWDTISGEAGMAKPKTTGDDAPKAQYGTGC